MTNISLPEGLPVSHPAWQDRFMFDESTSQRSVDLQLMTGEESDCQLLELCNSVADDFVVACLNADDPFRVKRQILEQISATMDFDGERASALFELALEVLHLRSYGQYRSEVTEIAYLITLVSGGADSLASN